MLFVFQFQPVKQQQRKWVPQLDSWFCATGTGLALLIIEIRFGRDDT